MVVFEKDGEKVKDCFGRSLKRLREDRGLSQEELGNESGYHRTYISQLERGQKGPSIQAVFQLARALRVTPSELIQTVEALLSQRQKP
jgi:transcriptional regulator with XRE-family HTH domain